MAVGAVSFHNDRLVKRFYVRERKNEIVNRLNKTKEERVVDYEAERQERERMEGRKKKEHALQQVRTAPHLLTLEKGNTRGQAALQGTGCREGLFALYVPSYSLTHSIFRRGHC